MISVILFTERRTTRRRTDFQGKAGIVLPTFSGAFMKTVGYMSGIHSWGVLKLPLFLQDLKPWY